VTGAGSDLLLEAIREQVGGRDAAGRLRLGPSEARLRARLYEAGAVVAEQTMDDGGWLLEVRLPARRFEDLCREAGIFPERLEAAPCAARDGFLQSRTVA
jgi:GTP-binding protein HflX